MPTDPISFPTGPTIAYMHPNIAYRENAHGVRGIFAEAPIRVGDAMMEIPVSKFVFPDMALFFRLEKVCVNERNPLHKNNLLTFSLAVAVNDMEADKSFFETRYDKACPFYFTQDQFQRLKNTLSGHMFPYRQREFDEMFVAYKTITGRADPSGDLEHDLKKYYVHCCSYGYTLATGTTEHKVLIPGLCLYNHASKHQKPRLRHCINETGTLLTIRSDANYAAGAEVFDTYCTPIKMVLPEFPDMVLYDDIVPMSCFYGIMETIHAGREAQFGYRVKDKSAITRNLLRRFHAFYFAETSITEDAALLDQCTNPLDTTAYKLRIIEKSYAKRFLVEAHRFLKTNPPPM